MFDPSKAATGSIGLVGADTKVEAIGVVAAVGAAVFEPKIAARGSIGLVGADTKVEAIGAVAALGAAVFEPKIAARGSIGPDVGADTKVEATGVVAAVGAAVFEPKIAASGSIGLVGAGVDAIVVGTIVVVTGVVDAAVAAPNPRADRELIEVGLVMPNFGLLPPDRVVVVVVFAGPVGIKGIAFNNGARIGVGVGVGDENVGEEITVVNGEVDVGAEIGDDNVGAASTVVGDGEATVDIGVGAVAKGADNVGADNVGADTIDVVGAGAANIVAVESDGADNVVDNVGADNIGPDNIGPVG